MKTKTIQPAAEQLPGTKGHEILSNVKYLHITGPESYEQAGALLVKIKDATNNAEAEKRKVLDPLNKARTAEINRWKPFEKDLEEANRLLKQKMIEYNEAIRVKAEEDQRKLQAKIDAGQITKPETIQRKMEAIEQVAPNLYMGDRSIKERIVREVEIIDELLIPRQYLEVNMVKLKKDALADVEIPGVRVVEKKQLATF